MAIDTKSVKNRVNRLIFDEKLNWGDDANDKDKWQNNSCKKLAKRLQLVVVFVVVLQEQNATRPSANDTVPTRAIINRMGKLP
jgi:hypothetical protein